MQDPQHLYGQLLYLDSPQTLLLSGNASVVVKMGQEL